MEMTVFVSYARKDQEHTDWLERLRYYLAPFRRLKSIKLWDDSMIMAGADWRSEISCALENANVTVLLVGPAFLASPFVQDYELPALLAKARDRGLRVFPLVIVACPYMQLELAPFQSFNNPDKPLESLPYHEQNSILNKLGIAISELSGQMVSSGIDTSKLCLTLRQIYQSCETNRIDFLEQNRKTGDLIDKIQARLGITEHLEFEPFFLRYYDKMNDIERNEFNEIRFITEGPILEQNKTILQSLLDNPALFEKLPDLARLQQHLNFWLRKFDEVFKQNRMMCVCYATEADSVPFPTGIQERISEWVTTNCTDE